ncbi:glycoside hydrolase family 31 protein [Gigaspora margarita]|uniref:alpha-glucosidase n=1 Tax=Gigaspora margarita TaxID=4874 RepID=A0A8H3XFG8_GIGMA|nr:glycoside hydrolase family 31 protein [Gigaspora margarita]
MSVFTIDKAKVLLLLFFITIFFICVWLWPPVFKHGVYTRIKSLLQITINETTISGYNALSEIQIDTCSLSDPSKDCGYFGITKEQCEARFCCWKPSNDSWCFYKKGPEYKCNVDPSTRVDCGYFGIQQDECENRLNCCWDPREDAIGVNYCFYRARPCNGYKVIGSQKSEKYISGDLELRGHGCGNYGPDRERLKFFVEHQTANRLHLKIFDPIKSRYEIPEDIVPISSIEPTQSDSLYQFSYKADPFTFSVARTSNQEQIINTDVPGVNSLVFEDQYLEITFELPHDPYIYGLGEVVRPLRRDPRGTFQTLWNRDAATPNDENIYGAQPFYMDVRNGTSHGVFLRNSNGMDVTITPGNPPKLTWKVIGGVFDFYFFLGPTPADVIAQYTELVGRPTLPPYWALGYHQCRWGYHNLSTLYNVVSEFRNHNIPLETIWNDLDYMEGFKDFTWNSINYPREEVAKFVNMLHENDQHYVVIVDPGIKIEHGYWAYEEGVKRGIFIKNAKGENIIGQVWPGFTNFPDWFNKDTEKYWGDSIEKWLYNVDIDGLWIDMNEPASWCKGECMVDIIEDQIFPYDSANDQKLDNIPPFIWNNEPGSITFTNTTIYNSNLNEPPYKINNGAARLPLDSLTLSMDARHANGFLEYDVHNLYGHMEAMITWKVWNERFGKGKRPFIITRSTFAGTGKYAGHWTGDNSANWDNLYLSIPGILNFQIFGIPLVGADICGFNGRTTEELCLRWMQLGSFYPFMRNHNAILESSQEPYIWPSVAATSRRYLRIRYSLLPYYYTLFYESHTYGSMVLRPLFIEYPHIKSALVIDKQFMLGGGILVSPVLLPQKLEVKDAYIPPGIWYNFYSHNVSFEVHDNSGIYSDINAPLNEMPIHLRGGHIIPMQRPRMTTAQTRKTNYYLIIPLDENESANGTLYFDDGESLDVKDKYTYISYAAYNQSTLVADVKWCGYDNGIILDKIIILGVNRVADVKDDGIVLKRKISRVMLNGVEIEMKESENKNTFIDIGDFDYSDNDIDTSDGSLWAIDDMEKLTFFGLQLSMCQGWNLTWVLD